MRAAPRRVVVCCLGLVVAAGAAGQADQEQETRLATLTSDQYVRAGADVRYYPFGRLETGDVVSVVGQKAGWARVPAVGPAFADSFAFIKYPRAGGAHFRVSSDARTGTTAAPTDVFAPNLDAKLDPASSWKPVATLPAHRAVAIIETVTIGDEIIHKIEMPDDAAGWIDLAHLRPATAAETAAWEAAVKSPTPRPAPQDETVNPEPAPVRQAPLGRAQTDFAATIERGTPVSGAAPTPAPAPGESPPAPAADKPAPDEPVQGPLARASQAPSRPRMARIMLDDLEAAYARLLAEPVESAEVQPLRLLYLDLADRHQASKSIAKFARTRARQLELWAEVQVRRAEMINVLRRAERTTESAEATRRTLEAFDAFVARGRLDVSTIYDGKRLPRLLRVRDVKTGRTLGYLEPDDRFEWVDLLGHEIGVVGEEVDDAGMRVVLLKPRRIELLDPDES